MGLDEMMHSSKSGLESSSADPALEAATSINQGDQLGETRETQRGLKSRHIQLIALGGTIGTGLFIGTGGSLAQSGPASLLLAYIIMSSLIWVIVLALGEMTSYMPVKELTVAHPVDRFLDPSVAFAVGWNYWYAYCMVPGVEATAVAVVIEYWTTDVHPAVWITITLFVTLFLNLSAVRYFGECEFWFASIKLIALVGLIILGFILCLGGGPNHDRLGFRYWQDPGSFKEFLVPGDTGRFLGLWQALIKSGFAFILSPEFLTNTAGECQAPRRNIPKATSRYIYRLVGFYVLGTLVIGILVPWDESRLLGSSNASASPFVIGIQNASIPVLNHILNAVILTAAWSASNSMLYAASRILYGMACKGEAPAVFKRCNRWGVPWVAVLASFMLGLLAYLNVSSTGANVFNWLTSLVTMSGMINWIVVLITFLQFRKATIYHGINDKLPFRSYAQPYSTYYAITFMCLICLTSGFAVFFPGRFNAADFITSYVSIPIFACLYLGHKLWTKSPGFRKIEEIDLFSGLEEVEEITANDVPPVPANIWEKVWFWLC
ncbi:hypothetical protein QQX98_010192 [Neonectria punicea]|uniref:Amino acid permease/ SLC12A domain-containing protein n=1 Tax=Neonectria punicea TaxID=979145 RepID=A0ABR1GQ49_9HYPO